jgi:hypothetical protein
MRDLDGRLRDLDNRLVTERTDLVGDIQVPEIGVIHSRARAVRRHRRMAGAATALALLSVVGAGTAVVLNNPAGRAPEVAASATATTWTRTILRGSGLTFHGLPGPVDDQPGQIYDIQFADDQRGYVLLADCRNEGEECPLTLLATTDGGNRWVHLQMPSPVASPDALPRLVPFGTEQVGLLAGDAAYIRSGANWTSLNAASPPTVGSVPKGGRLWTPGGEGCDPRPLYVWGMAGTLGVLATPPPMQVCRVAGGPGGAWWVGGYDSAGGRRPAVAVSHDAGRHWQMFRLPAAGGGAWAQVSPLGTEVYASVVSPRGGEPYPDEALILHTVYRSADGGPFQPYGPANTTIVGDLVPLLDGRLLAAGPMWYVSADGAPFRNAGGDLPYVGRFARSPGGWIAYDLYQAGYAAVSRDGVEWHKFTLR